MVYSEWIGSSPSHIHSCNLPSCQPLMPKSKLLAQTFRYNFFPSQVEAHRFEQTMHQVLPKPSILVRGENYLFLKIKPKLLGERLETRWDLLFPLGF